MISLSFLDLTSGKSQIIDSLEVEPYGNNTRSYLETIDQYLF